MLSVGGFGAAAEDLEPKPGKGVRCAVRTANATRERVWRRGGWSRTVIAGSYEAGIERPSEC
jgi:hypothetical protein